MAASTKTEDTRETLDRLRSQVDDLSGQAPNPAVAAAVDKASAAASATQEFLIDLSDKVRQQPLGAVFAAVAVGYIFRKLTR